jgi:hypothetical protein
VVVVRSFLAGLRQLIVPWGRRHAPRIVIGGEDPIANSLDLDSAIVFYLTDTRVALLAADTDGTFGYLRLSIAEQGAAIAQILDVYYDISADQVTQVQVAASNVDAAIFGGGATTAQLGGFDTTTVRIRSEDQVIIKKSADAPLPLDPPEIILGNKTLGFETQISNQTPPPADTTAVGPVAWDTIGATTKQFVKQYDDSRAEIHMGVGMFSTAGGTVGQYGVRISGFADVLVGQVLLSSPSVENAGWAVAEVPGPMPAGTYTLTPLWRRASGAGTLTITASSGTLSYKASEIIE